MNRDNKDYEKILEAEVAHWKRLAADAEKVWRRQNAIGRHRFGRRVEFIRERLRPGDACFELGCGIGLLTESIITTGATVTAMDLSPDLLEFARRRVMGATFILGDVCRSGLPDSVFDSVVGCSVLHHLDIARALPEIFRVLKPGGWIRFTEPNYMNPHIVLERKIPWLRDKLGVTRFETAFFRWSFAKRLKRAGFESVSVEPFDFLYPFLPDRRLNHMLTAERALEHIPVAREFAGSIRIEARRPA